MFRSLMSRDEQGDAMAIVKVPISDTTEVDVADPPVLYIEVEGAPVMTSAWDTDTVRGNRAEKAVAVATDLLDDAVGLARACAEKFSAGLAGLKEGARSPDEISLEIGITMDAEFGAVLARARAGAQLQVTLTWQHQE
jgi:Trypsin-co-occurring domain 1